MSIKPKSSIDQIRASIHPTNPILCLVTKSYQSGANRVKVYQADDTGYIRDQSYNMAWLCHESPLDAMHGFKLNVGYQPGQYIAELLAEKAGIKVGYQTDYIG